MGDQRETAEEATSQSTTQGAPLPETTPISKGQETGTNQGLEAGRHRPTATERVTEQPTTSAESTEQPTNPAQMVSRIELTQGTESNGPGSGSDEGTAPDEVEDPEPEEEPPPPDRQKLTKSQKRRGRQADAEMRTLPAILDGGPEEITRQQEADEILRPYREAVGQSEELFKQDGLLWQRTTNRMGERNLVLILPTECRATALRTAHRPGHLGRDRTKAMLMEQYILVLRDYHSRWPEAKAVQSNTSRVVVDFLVEVSIRFGVPDELLTDRSKYFVSSLCTQLCKILGIRQLKTTAYHPQTDGVVERFNRTMGRLLDQAEPQFHGQWDEALPIVLGEYRSTPCRATGFAPSELMFGRNIRTPVRAIRDQWAGTSTVTKPIGRYLTDLVGVLDTLAAAGGNDL